MRFWKAWFLFGWFAVVVSVFLPSAAQYSKFGSHQPPQEATQLPRIFGKKPKNIILLIGDGMTLTSITAARFKAVGPNGWLHMNRMPIAGFVRTCSADKLITDSGASATAMATGQKTNNNAIGKTPDGKNWETILEAFQKESKASGLVVLSPITDATPAPFYAHIASRKEQPTIAEQLVDKKIKINVLLGGGRAFFEPQSVQGNRRTDERDLIAEARDKGYAFADTREAMLGTNARFLLGLFASEWMTMKPPEPTLAEMAEKAVQLLSTNRNGFFLMIEGSRIDGANSDNDTNDSIQQVLDFDTAVAKMLDFAVKNEHTLVVVTSDHESGGMSIVGGSLDGSKLEVVWTKKGHIGGTVPLYAFGPGSEKMSGFLENTDIPRIFATLLKMDDFPVMLNQSP